MVVKLRETYDFPVIFLSAKSEEVDKIMGLNMGSAVCRCAEGDRADVGAGL